MRRCEPLDQPARAGVDHGQHLYQKRYCARFDLRIGTIILYTAPLLALLPLASEPDFTDKQIFAKAAEKYINDPSIFKKNLDLIIIDESQDFETEWITLEGCALFFLH